jgi:hypothetical protein
MDAYVWIMHESGEILLTDDPGPPVGGVLVGSWPITPGVTGWGPAHDVAAKKAQELGYAVEVNSRFLYDVR